MDGFTPRTCPLSLSFQQTKLSIIYSLLAKSIYNLLKTMRVVQLFGNLTRNGVYLETFRSFASVS